jgi:type III pantothenate kinase
MNRMRRGQLVMLVDIGNTNTHLGMADARGVVKHEEMPTRYWREGKAARRLARFHSTLEMAGMSFCSVVPQATRLVRRWAGSHCAGQVFELSVGSICGIGVDYPRPETIGADRLANALAARVRFGAPVLVVDFGTAVTFDVVDARGNYVGGVIAPGLSAMTDYLHERTALLPRVRIRAVRRYLGRSTEEAMRIGAVHGYRGLVRELIAGLRRELEAPGMPVVATGGYAGLMARGLPEIRKVNSLLTLEGLRLFFQGTTVGKRK